MRATHIEDIIWDAAASLAKQTGERIHLLGTAGGVTADPGTSAGMLTADALIADLGRDISQVLTEIGQAQARSVPVILLIDDPGKIPPHLKHYPAVFTEGSSFSTRAPGLANVLREVLWPSLVGDLAAASRATVFISYSHHDLRFLKRVLVHLRPLERHGIIHAWSDEKLSPGDKWKDEIRAALERARIAVVLISADFLASEFYRDR